MSTSGRVVKNTGYLYMRLAISMVASLITTRLILNALGASDFGIFNVVAGAINMLAFLNGSMSASTQRFMSYAEGQGDKTKKNEIFRSSIILHLLICLLVVIILEMGCLVFFNGILSIPEEREGAAMFIYQCAVATTVFSIMAVPYEAVLNAHENMLYYSIVGILESILKLVVAIVVVYTAMDKLCIYGISMAMVSLVIRAIMQFYCKRRYEECRLKLFEHIGVKTLKEMTKFAGWSSASTLSWLFCHQGLGIILNHYFGTTLNAAHALAYQLSGQLGALSTSAMKSLNPVIVKNAGAGNYNAMYKATLFGNKALFYLASVTNLPVLANAGVLLLLWLKNVPVYTEIFVTLYFTANLIDTLCINQPTAIGGVGNIRAFQLSCSVVNILPPIACIILFSYEFPPYTLYLLMIVAAFLKLLLRILYSAKVCGFSITDMLFNDVTRCIFPFVVSIVIASLISGMINTYNIYILAICVLLEVAIYSLLYFIFAFNASDKKYLISMALSYYKRILKYI